MGSSAREQLRVPSGGDTFQNDAFSACFFLFYRISIQIHLFICSSFKHPSFGRHGITDGLSLFLLFYSFKSRFSASVPQFKEKSFKIGNKWDPEAQQLLCE